MLSANNFLEEGRNFSLGDVQRNCCAKRIPNVNVHSMFWESSSLMFILFAINLNQNVCNCQNMEWSGTNDYLSSARLCSKAFQMPLLCLMEVFIHLQSEFLEENIWIARRRKDWLISLRLIEFCFWQPLAGQVEREQDGQIRF